MSETIAALAGIVLGAICAGAGVWIGMWTQERRR